MRTEFGAPRTNCSCKMCRLNCKVMPGYLIPADLERMIPAGADPFRWAEENLLASPGALVMKRGKSFRIPTLVPATKPDGSCIHLTKDERCDIHDVAPFGCAFFDCGPEPPGVANQGLAAVYQAHASQSLYYHLVVHLNYKGLTQKAPEKLRAVMRAS
jgi:hypothetical protein